MIAFDTETHRFSEHRRVPRAVCVSLAWRGEGIPLPPTAWTAQEGDVRVAVVSAQDFDPEALLEYEGYLVAHNAPYDAAVLADYYEGNTLARFWERIGAGGLRDTGVRERLLRLAFGQFDYFGGRPTGYSLADLVQRYFGEDISESKTDPNAWRLRYGELEDIPVQDWPPEALEYAAGDSYWTLLLHDAQIERNDAYSGGYPVHDGAGAVVSEEREVAADLALFLEGAWGLRTERPRVEATIAEWQRTAAAGQVVGEAAGFVRVKGRDKGKAGSIDLKKLRDRIRWALGDAAPGYMSPPSATFPAGQLKYDLDTLTAAVALSGDEALQGFAASLQQKNWLAKYAPALERGLNGPILPSYRHLVSSGRTSAFDPPIQQPPRSGTYRECHAPRPGYLYCGADYDFVELCTLGQAQLWALGSSRLAEVINEGRDPHLHTAMTMLQAAGGSAPRDYAEALAWKKAGRPEIKEARQQAKALNFGLPGMMGVPKFRIYAWKSYRVRFSEEQAHELKALWLAEYVEQRAYWAWVDRVTANGALQQFVSQRVRGRVSGPAAANTIFQGLAADGAKFAAVLLSAAGYTGEIPYDVPSTVQEAAAVYRGCRPVLFLHDEVIAEVPEEKAAICAEAQSTIMKYAMTLHVPDVRIGCKPVLMRRWAKGIDPTYAADGTLIPTEVA